VQGTKTIGQRINEAMDLLMSDNPSLEGTLPRLFNRPNVDQRRLAELLDLLNSVQFTGHGASKARDLLGEVYEYFLAKFASAEGRRGGEFYTPASVVRVIVEMLQPRKGRVYDPCCGSGGMFVQAEKFLAAHNDDPTQLSVFGQELNESTWRMAKMNLAIHGLNGNLGPRWGDTFSLDYHAGVPMDYVMANPPFNISDWNRKEEDARWVYGVPPAGNANYAWLQHIVSHLAPHGTGGVVMANGSMTTNSGGEGEIRAQLVENDLVACMVAMPEKLFRSVGIPVCVWFFARDKAAGPNGSIDRRGQVLFIDARGLGHMVTRAEKALSDADIAKIADTYHAWRGMERLGIGTRDVTETGNGADGDTVVTLGSYQDLPGFCRSASIADIKHAGYALSPGRYVGAAEADRAEDVQERVAELTLRLQHLFDDSARLQSAVEEQLGRLA
jgi:type I restriction enzyme M protein